MMQNPASDYRHRPKTARPGIGLQTAFGHLKWYDLEEPDFPVAAATRAAGQLFCGSDTQGLADMAGFAILHRCGPDFHFLLTGVWLGNNELWQAVRYIDAATPNFTAFAPAYPDPGHLRPTFCVWEMGIVAHEALAWQRYLSSDRDAAALDRWKDDCLHGPV